MEYSGGVFVLEVRNVSKSFKVKREEKKVLQQVSFDVNNQETVGIIGASGCGKSTLARILCGTIKKDSGTIIYNMEPVIFKSGKYNQNMRRKIQMIGQQPFLSLDPVQKIGKAIMEPMLYHKMGTLAQCQERTQELIERVWLDKRVLQMYPHELSGGMCQRVVIARACGLNPEFIIADESTSMLDTSAQAQVIRLLHQLKEENGISILFISHDTVLVNAFSDRVLRMENHKLIF